MVFRRAIEEVEKAYYQDQAKLIDRIAELENVQAGLLERGIALEQLCRDMYRLLAFALDGNPGELAAQASLARSIHDRMDGFGLLEGWKMEGGDK